MSDLILQTKLYMPALRGSLVYRPELTKRLEYGLDGKLTLVCAPAGFGKTTLITNFLKQGQIDLPCLGVSWLSLDDNDNNLARFLHYIIVSLQQIHPQVGHITQKILNISQSNLVLEPLMTTLLNDLATIQTKTILVLDDYHLIKTDVIHQAIDFLLTHLPPHIHLIVISRSEPAFHLARLRTRQQLTELNMHDLRFSLDETNLFLNAKRQLNLSNAEIASLERRTEGWIAGLQLAALSLADLNLEARQHFINQFAGNHRYVFDYLFEEVFIHQPEIVRTFLERTCILTRLNASLCAAILEDVSKQEAQRLLTLLEQRNLFVIPLDSNRGWYRYHHLFADLLHNQLATTQPDLIPILHQRASAWYAEENLIQEAIRHTLVAKDFEMALTLIEQIDSQLINKGEFQTLTNWLDKFPPQFADKTLQIQFLYCQMLLFTGPFEALEKRLEIIESIINQTEPAYINHFILIVRIHVARYYGDMETVTKYTKQLEISWREEPDNKPGLEIGILIALVSDFIMRGNFTEGEKLLKRALQVAESINSYSNIIYTKIWISRFRLMQGLLPQAIDLNREIITNITEDMPAGVATLPSAGSSYIRLASLLVEQSNFTEAELYLKQGLDFAIKWQLDYALQAGQLVLVRLRLGQGDVVGAVDALNQAPPFPSPTTPRHIFNEDVAARRAHAILIGHLNSPYFARNVDINPLVNWLKHRNLSLNDAIPFYGSTDYLLWAQLLIIQGAFKEVLAVLNYLLPTLEKNKIIPWFIEGLILKAIAQIHLGNHKAGSVTLRKALTLAAPQALIQIFVEGGPIITKLLKEFITQQHMPGLTTYFKKILNVAHTFSAIRTYAIEEAPSSPQTYLVDPLTPREVEVLQLLHVGLSGPEIADKLVISLNTVRSHTKNIYSKLNVTRRQEALERARELYLIA